MAGPWLCCFFFSRHTSSPGSALSSNELTCTSVCSAGKKENDGGRIYYYYTLLQPAPFFLLEVVRIDEYHEQFYTLCVRNTIYVDEFSSRSLRHSYWPAGSRVNGRVLDY